MCPDWESNQRHFSSQVAVNPLSHTDQDHFLFFINKVLLEHSFAAQRLHIVYSCFGDTVAELNTFHINHMARNT